MASSSGISYGNTKIIWPTGIHKATIVWLHDIGDNGLNSARFLKTLNLPNIKWICPTAPMRPVTSWGGTEATSWCDITEISENMQDDLVSLNYVSSFLVSLLAHEPPNVIKGLGGIGLGAAQALYFASCYASGWDPLQIGVVVGINGWLPAWRNMLYHASISGAANRAPSLPILLTHGSGTVDNVVPFTFGYKCADSLRVAGFPITFKPNEGDHYTVGPQVISEVRVWLTTYLQL